MAVVPVGEVRSVCLEALDRGKAPRDIALAVVDALVWADLRGVSSHGVRNLPVYLRRASLGGLDPGALPVTESERGAIAVMDGRNGFGQVAGKEAVAAAVRMARHHGTGAVWMRNTNHIGALGYYTSLAVERGYISFMAGNVNPTVAPFGGAEARLGTNPVSFAFPGPGFPIVADMATSAAAKGKIYEMAARGLPIPSGWSLDSQGRPTTSAEEATKGVLLPASGPKGYALAVAVEIMAGIMTGSVGRKVRSVHNEPSKPQGAGFFLAVWDPGAVLPAGDYERRVRELKEYLSSCRKAEGADEVMLPGEPEARRSKERERSGIPIADEDWNEIRRLAGRRAD